MHNLMNSFSVLEKKKKGKKRRSKYEPILGPFH
jgi:hypothetical protein